MLKKKEQELIKKARKQGLTDELEYAIIHEVRRSGIEYFHLFENDNGPLVWGWRSKLPNRWDADECINDARVFFGIKNKEMPVFTVKS